LNDPGSVFDRPRDVLDAPGLSVGQKRQILRQWKQEVVLRLVAEDENMSGSPANADRLRQISNALIALEAS